MISGANDYPPVNVYKKLLKMVSVKFVDLPINGMVIFHRFPIENSDFP